MKKTLLILALTAFVNAANAIEANTVVIIYNGTTATVNIASNISSYVTVLSDNSSHVKIVQDAAFAGVDKTVDNEDGEIIYTLSGTSTDGEFYMEGGFKATVELNGVTLTNPNGPALNIQDGKRIVISAKKNTISTLTDGANEEYNGCIHCKGHTKMKGKGILNVVGNSKHAVYSKEYLEIKNLTLNVNSALKDGIHCKDYFLMESGTVKVSGAQDDGIQVELGSGTITDITTDHEDENTGNFYMLGGVLTIENYANKAVKTDGIIKYTGGTRNYNTDDTEILTSISSASVAVANSNNAIYDMNGRRVSANSNLRKGLYVVNRNGRMVKVQCK